MKIPKLLLEKEIQESQPLEKKLTDYMNTPYKHGPENSAASGFALRLKKYRDQINELRDKPYESSAEILTKSHDKEKIIELLIEAKENLNIALNEEKEVFYPALAAGDFSAHELMIQRAEDYEKSIKVNGLAGINEVFDELERSFELGKYDFTTEMINKIDNYFSEKAILSGQPYLRFQEIKKDFLRDSDRGKILNKIQDLKNGRDKILEYDKFHKIIERV